MDNDMREIRVYEVRPFQTVSPDYKIIHFARKDLCLCAWIETNPYTEQVSLDLIIKGKNSIVPKGSEHAGTIFEDNVTWHLYDRTIR